MMQVLVVDDEALARARLRTLLGDCSAPKAQVLAEAGDAISAMNFLQTTAGQSCDVVLLDIHMPGADGMQLARELRAMPSAPAIIFVTAHAEHALAAFDLDAVDYLTKPVRLERLQAALLKAERAMTISRRHLPEKPQESLIIHDRGKTLRVELAEVLYFKAELKYVTVVTAQKSHILDGTLSELELKYADTFLRIHRNTLVAKRAMRAIEKHHDNDESGLEAEGWGVRLAGAAEVLAVSRRQVAAVRAAIAQL
jgi:two-component system, LytTR family, response regulator AlgR